ncbi:hypothetical protein LZK74_25420 (plasmid) [Sinorhizobium meliloti]|nr:hypothetical protein LZK74_25420 [Sinorhizobium meliloti]
MRSLNLAGILILLIVIALFASAWIAFGATDASRPPHFGADHGRRVENEKAYLGLPEGHRRVPPRESGTSARELVQMLIARLHGREAKDALGGDWQGWWPDDDDGGSPAPRDREMA